MIAATPNERVCLQNCFDTGSDGYWVRRMRQLPRAPQRGPTTGPRTACGPGNNFAQILSITGSGNLFFWRTL